MIPPDITLIQPGPLRWHFLPPPNWHGFDRPGQANTSQLCSAIFSLAKSLKEATQFEDTNQLEALVAVNLLANLLGEQWVFKHFIVKARSHSFFRSIESGVDDTWIRFLRIVGLYDLIINLCFVSGFEKVFEELKAADDVEPIYAELEAASLLYKHGVQFRFIKPQNKLGKDYDFEISLNGTTFCADAKCKLESTSVSMSTILDSLRTAQTQVPDDRPAVVVVKLPQNWLDDDLSMLDLVQVVDAATKKFFRHTRRVVFVIYYISVVLSPLRGGRAPQWCWSCYNDRNRFGVPRLDILTAKLGQIPHWFSLRWVLLPFIRSPAAIFATEASTFYENLRMEHIIKRSSEVI